MPGFAPVAEVRLEFFGGVGLGELVRGGVEGFAFGEVFAFVGDFAVGGVGHGEQASGAKALLLTGLLRRG